MNDNINTKSFYSNTISNFVSDNQEKIIGILTKGYANAGFANLIKNQIEAWKIEIDLLQNIFKKLIFDNSEINKWHILIEYPIPRRNCRADVILLIKNFIVVIEFKIFSKEYLTTYEKQLLEYCYDLRDFHLKSANKFIYPILVCTEADNFEFPNNNGNEFVKSTYFVAGEWVENAFVSS